MHTETSDGSVIPIWEEVRPGNVAVMKDVMAACKASWDDVDVFYRRVPLTAERSPDFSDFNELIAVMLGPNMTHTPIVVNDQLGRGRSTLTSVRASVNWRKRCPHTHLRWVFIRSFSFCSSIGSQVPCRRVLESAGAVSRFWPMGRLPKCNLAILPFDDNHTQSLTVCSIMSPHFPP